MNVVFIYLIIFGSDVERRTSGYVFVLTNLITTLG